MKMKDKLSCIYCQLERKRRPCFQRRRRGNLKSKINKLNKTLLSKRNMILLSMILQKRKMNTVNVLSKISTS